MRRLLGVFITLLITGFFNNTYGQGGNCTQGFADINWYFGDQGQGIQFSKNQSMEAFVPTATLNIGGTAVASDPSTGTVLFYTDGQNIYDVTHTLMPNGSGLPANISGNQPVAISRNPANPDQYYIFTNTANGSTPGTIQFTVIDMGLTGNAVFPEPSLGAVDITNKNQATGIVNASEAMIVVANANADGFWLITHENGAANYLVMEINNLGVIQVLPPVSLGAITQAANISYHAATNRLAVTSQLNEDVEILDFDAITGALTSNSTVANSGNAGSVYDTEWGYSGDILYLSREGAGANIADVFQYDLTNPGLVSVLTNTIDMSYGLQLAPDSAIYHLYQATPGGDFLLASITSVDSLTTNPSFSYQDNLFNGQNIGANQFPAFLPPYRENFTLSIVPNAAICLNSAITFYPILINNNTLDTVAIDAAFWDFTEGQSNDLIPTFTFQDVNTAAVTLNAISNGCVYNTMQAIAITDFQLQISMTSDTTFCMEEFPPPRGTDGTANVVANISGGTPASINWFGPGGDTGQTSATLLPDSAGYYYVVVSDGTCSAYQGVNVQEYGLQEQRANIWYFGQNAGIDFNQTPAVALSDSQMNAPEGCSAMSDRNGNIVLYTDGVDVYDREHTQITTSNLGGDQGATQSALIVPFTNDETRYYIFTNEQIYGTNTFQLKYSVFDLKLNNGLGDLEQRDILLLSPSTERVTASANWLIAHEYGNNTFRAYPITPTGVGNPVYSNIGMDHLTTSSEMGQGYMKLGANNLLAVALSDGTNNYVELFDLDPATGDINNYRQIDLTADANTGNVYGVEISPGGNKIFATAGTKVFEYYLDSLGDPQSLANNNFETGLGLGAIQIAPDGQIYVAINNSATLGTITPNEDTTQVSSLDITAAPFTLAGGTQSRLGLPNFIQSLSSPALSPAMTVQNGCPGDSLNFTATGTSTIDEFRWNIINSLGAVVQSSSVQNPSFFINTAGTYTANVFIFNRCIASPNQTITMPFEIFAPPTFNLTATNTTVCGLNDGAISVNLTSTGPYTYTVNGPVSSSGGPGISGNQSITALSAGAYFVTLTDDVNGCADTQFTNVNDPTPYTLSGSGITECDGTNGTLTMNFDGANAIDPATVVYTLIDEATTSVVAGHNAVNANVVSSNTFDITGIAQGTYTVQILDDGCTSSLSGIAVVPPAPYGLIVPFSLDGCGGTAVSIPINTDAPSVGILLTGSGATETVFPTNANGSEIDITIDNITAGGTYQIRAFDASDIAPFDPCPVAANIVIGFNEPTASPLDPQYIICPEDPDPAVMTTTLKAGLEFITVRWFDDNNNLLQNGNGYTFAGDSIVVNVAGTIVAELTNPFGCITMDTISIVEDCQPRIVAPNAFRPSSSVGENQNFSIYSLFLKEDAFEVYIYNRWGELVFQSADLNFQWNGGYGNSLSKPLPLGTYAYIVKYVDTNNEARGVQEQRGGVLLIR